MDVTHHIRYLSYEILRVSIDILIIDHIFLQFMNALKHNTLVKIHASYFYDNTHEDEWYSFEGINELLDGLLQLSYGTHNDEMNVFVEKLESSIQMYRLTEDMAIL